MTSRTAPKTKIPDRDHEDLGHGPDPRIQGLEAARTAALTSHPPSDDRPPAAWPCGRRVRPRAGPRTGRRGESLMSKSSSRSGLIRRMPAPTSARLQQALPYVRRRTDVEPAVGVVRDDQVRVPGRTRARARASAGCRRRADAGVSPARARASRRAQEGADEVSTGASASRPKPLERGIAMAVDDRVVANDSPVASPSAGPILRNVGDAAPVAAPPAPALGSSRPVSDAGERVLAVADHAGHADDLAAADRERDIVETDARPAPATETVRSRATGSPSSRAGARGTGPSAPTRPSRWQLASPRCRASPRRPPICPVSGRSRGRTRPSPRFSLWVM